MYNRYIPQPDGTHQRRTLPEPVPEETDRERDVQSSFAKEEPPFSPGKEAGAGNSAGTRYVPKAGTDRPGKPQPGHCHSNSGQSAGGFLRSLLPADFDTGDLLVVLLLLLIAGDCRNDRNTALLTLALYLFL